MGRDDLSVETLPEDRAQADSYKLVSAQMQTKHLLIKNTLWNYINY
jgi:hypothetical protein